MRDIEILFVMWLGNEVKGTNGYGLLRKFNYLLVGLSLANKKQTLILLVIVVLFLHIILSNSEAPVFFPVFFRNYKYTMGRVWLTENIVYQIDIN